MKKAAFLFLALFISVSSVWATPTATGTSPVAIVVAEDEAPKVCTITIKGTYNGTPVDLTITVEADNCAQAAADFLKRMAQK